MTSPENSLRRGDVVEVDGEIQVVFIVHPQTVHTLSLVGEGDKQHIAISGGGVPMELLTPTGVRIPPEKLKELYVRGIVRSGLTKQDAKELWAKLQDIEND